MKKYSQLSYYSLFQEILEKRNYAALENYIDREIWMRLEKEERNLLSELFFRWGEQLIVTGQPIEKVEQAFSCSETLNPDNPDNWARQSLAFFRFGLTNRKVKFLTASQELLSKIQKEKPDYIKDSYELMHLWGNCLVALGQYIGESEQCIVAHQKFERAIQCLDLLIKKEDNPFRLSFLKGNKAEILWHWGLSWFVLGKRSGESSDFFKTIEFYKNAADLFITKPASFLMDYATVYHFLGRLSGKTFFVQNSIDLFKQAIADNYPIREGESKENAQESIYAECWIRLAEASKTFYQLTADPKRFDEAEEIFRKASFVSYKKETLWLDWAKLHLIHGGFYNISKGYEICIEKLTTLLSAKTDPIRMTSYLGQALIGLGVLWDDLKLLREGLKRIIEFLDLYPDHPEMILAAGLSSLSFGNYFSDEKYLLKAIEFFQYGLSFENYQVEFLHGLFLCQMSFGELNGQQSHFRAAIDSMKRICELRPECPPHFNEWAVAYMKLREICENEEEELYLIENAIEKLKIAINLQPEQKELEWLYNYGCALDILAELTLDEIHYHEAISIFKEILILDPHFQNAKYNLALTLCHHGMYASDADSFLESIEIFEQIIHEENEDDLLWYDYGNALLNLSDLLYDSNYPEKSLDLNAKAEKALLKSASFGNSNAYYLLACLYSLSQCYEKSIFFLEKSEASDALPDLEDLMHDDWLENVRNTEQFRDFIALRRG